jgi:predicted flap endonuclease-1-like 5' DNA nuclease
MTSFVVLFVMLAALAVGVYAGWVLRSRMDAPGPDDPEAELRSLRETHAGCATRIRNLHLELAQLETKLSMSRIDGPPRPSPASVTDDDLAGAARLASLMDVLESGTESEQTAAEDVERPAAFMSILPADLVDSQALREPPDEQQSAPVDELVPVDGLEVLPIAPIEFAPLVDVADVEIADVEIAVAEVAVAEVAVVAAPETVDEAASAPKIDLAPEVLPDVVIALDGDDPVIELETIGDDDLTLIKGIGPKIAAILNQQGITTFRQIAELDEAQIEVLGHALGAFRGRIVRDDWVGAARQMVGATASR